MIKLCHSLVTWGKETRGGGGNLLINKRIKEIDSNRQTDRQTVRGKETERFEPLL